MHQGGGVGSARADMRPVSSRFGFSRGMGFGCRRPSGDKPGRDADALFALSCRSTTLDRRPRRAETADDLPARQGTDEHVPPLLSQRPGFLAALIPELTSIKLSAMAAEGMTSSNR